MNTVLTSTLSGVMLAAASLRPADPHFSVVRLPDGAQLHYAVQGDSTGDPIIFLHGYSDSWFSFSGVLPLLPGSYRAYALDLRGHGNTERSRSGYGMADMATDVIAFMDARQIARATIVGHSMGSIVAQQVALLAPRRVASLVLLGAGTTVRNVNGIGDLRQAVFALEDTVPVQFVRKFQESTIHRPLPDAFLQRVIAESRKLAPHVWREVMTGMLSTGPATALGKAGIPALVIWGDRDTTFLEAEQDALVSMLGSATFKRYAGTGHAVHWEEPARFAADLQSFLSAATYGSR